jgi:membrane protease YdiL (CAAX protease family)
MNQTSDNVEENMRKKSDNSIFILTPIVILIVTQVTAIMLGKFLQALVYLPVILIYWAVIVLILYIYGFDNISRWLEKPQGNWGWIILAVLLGFSSLPLFINNIDIFRNSSVLIPHIAFFLINPWLEEFYWRGLLIDVTKKWPAWVSLLYSSVLFTLWHTAFAWYSMAFRELSFYVPVFIYGFFMVLIYKNTKSLWLCIASHMLINILNMGIPVLMNLVKF